jgi:hypothetical protein
MTSAMDYQRLYDYRLRGIDQGSQGSRQRI